METLKKFALSFALAVGLAIALTPLDHADATGTISFIPPSLGPNPVEVGSFASTNQYTNVISFPYVFTVPPVVLLSPGVTNYYTNIVTTTNFTVSTGQGITNTWNWSALYPYYRTQYGSQAINGLAAGGATNVTFTVPYSSAPSVILTPGNAPAATNEVPIVTAITATGFTITAPITGTVYWQAFGPTSSQGPNTPTF